jgi:putative transposase
MAAGVKISMDGRGRWMDNVFVERLWRSLKHDDIYLKGYADGREAKAGIGAWVAFYNSAQPHQALGNRTPMALWREGISGNLGDTAVDMTLRLDHARVAHIPTAVTAAKGVIDSMISTGRSGLASN